MREEIPRVPLKVPFDVPFEIPFKVPFEMPLILKHLTFGATLEPYPHDGLYTSAGAGT